MLKSNSRNHRQMIHFNIIDALFGNSPSPCVIALAALIPVLKWDGEENLAKGEIVKFNYSERNRNQHKFNAQVVGCKDGYDMIWRHISDDWFKVVGKSPERSC